MPPLLFYTLLFAPLCPAALSAAGAIDSVVVSPLRHYLGLLGGAGSPVALQGRHSVPAHNRHNLLLSPVSKPTENHPQNNTTVRAVEGGGELRKPDVFLATFRPLNPSPPT